MKSNLVEGVDFYYNAEGLLVLAESYHRERGYCCGNGCLHCPFAYSAVPEPRKSELIRLRESGENALPRIDVNFNR